VFGGGWGFGTNEQDTRLGAGTRDRMRFAWVVPGVGLLFEIWIVDASIFQTRVCPFFGGCVVGLIVCCGMPALIVAGVLVLCGMSCFV
jgi:hypothetical protein